MSDNHNNVYEFDANLICNFFLQTERQGPGSPEATKQALRFIGNLQNEARIADLGCGTGGQTFTLAENAPGTITAVDLFPGFVEKLNLKARRMNLQDRVRGVVGSMDKLSFQRESLDLIWSEGAIYNIGFERGINEWRDYLKPGGYIAVSESSWFTSTRPAEIEEYWMQNYDQMDTIPTKTAQLQKAGYVPVAVFALPENCWIENYYLPMAEAKRRFLDLHPGNLSAANFVEYLHTEESLYRKYKEYYGYVFYIGKKI